MLTLSNGWKPDSQGSLVLFWKIERKLYSELVVVFAYGQKDYELFRYGWETGNLSSE